MGVCCWLTSRCWLKQKNPKLFLLLTQYRQHMRYKCRRVRWSEATKSYSADWASSERLLLSFPMWESVVAKGPGSDCLYGSVSLSSDNRARFDIQDILLSGGLCR